MKFRYKVILLNLILLSLITGIVSFLLMQRSYRLTMDTEIKSAVTENNLVQSSVEYSLLEVVNSGKYDLKVSLPEIGRTVFSGMLSGEEALFLRYGGEYLYLSENGNGELFVKIPDAAEPAASSSRDAVLGDYAEEFFNFTDDNHKNYILAEAVDPVNQAADSSGEPKNAQKKNTFLFVTSDTRVDGKALNIITRRDISELSDLLNQSITDSRRITVILLASATLLLFLLSWLLTRPLERLSHTTNAFAAGDYTVRSDLHSTDEVGHLADRFNSMADSVEDHVEELNDMIHRREQFVADFTHEIKTPMTSIIGYADTMRSVDLSREEQQTALSYIFSEGKRLEAMSMKLFDLLYLKDHPIERRTVSASALSQSVAESMKPLMEASKVTLNVSVQPGSFPGDPDLLKSVFINLIDNARKASPEGSVVEFTGAPGKYVPDADTSGSDPKKKNAGNSGENNVYRFTVRDHGIGISKEDQKKIFDEFFMADKSRTRAAGGAGLGMSLVAVILERHEASIELESTPGEGSTFTVSLPCGDAE